MEARERMLQRRSMQMKKMKTLGLMCFLIVVVASCSKSHYHVKSADMAVSSICTETGKDAKVSSVIYGFDSDVPRQVKSISSQRGIELENIVINLADILEKSTCPELVQKRSTAVQVHSYQHRSSFSPDTGYMFVAVRISSSATLDCSQGEIKNVETSYLSRRFQTNFMSGSKSIQQALNAATNDAAIGLTQRLQAYCEGTVEGTDKIENRCPPGWTKDYEGCNPG